MTNKSATGTTKPKRKAAVRRPAAVPQVAADAKHRWIAEAAYYRAEQRGFSPGRELDDWLEAEKALNASDVLAVPAASKRARSRPAVSGRRLQASS